MDGEQMDTKTVVCVLVGIVVIIVIYRMATGNSRMTSTTQVTKEPLAMLPYGYGEEYGYYPRSMYGTGADIYWNDGRIRHAGRYGF